MNARAVLEAIVIHEYGEARHEPSMVVLDGTLDDRHASGVMTDPDGNRWYINIWRG